MTRRMTVLVLGLLLVLCFGLAAWLQPRSLQWRGERAAADTILKVFLGDGRRMFANHFFTKADVYLHSGFYPSIFDQAQLNCDHALEGAETDPDHVHDQEGEADHDEDHKDEHDFLGEPKDWLDRFGRRFRVTEHQHLGGGGAEREILPWLKLAAELDPQQIETYTVAAYWLRTKLDRVEEAEAFLRDGLRANPDSEEILFELGRLLYDARKDAGRARNLWELALRKWRQHEAGTATPNIVMLDRILMNLARLEENEGNWGSAIQILKQLKEISPNADAITKQIDELQRKVR